MSIPTSGTVNSANLYQLTTPAGVNAGGTIDALVGTLGLGSTAFVAGTTATNSNATFSTTTVNNVSSTSVSFTGGPTLSGIQLLNQGAGGFTFSDSTGATFYLSKTAIAGGTQIDVNTAPSTGLIAGTLDTLVAPNPTIFVGASNTTTSLDGSVFIACFLSGTMIDTPDGEVAVQDLRIGDLVLNASRRPKQILWIGRRTYRASFARGNDKVTPICFSAGCLSEGVPSRDLYVSPAHALLIDGVLIPAEHLLTEGSVTRGFRDGDVAYFHLELEDHDVVWANGVTAETYVDDDNRSMFENADEYHALYPSGMMEAAIYCVSRMTDGDVVQAVRNRLARRAIAPRALAA